MLVWAFFSFSRLFPEALILAFPDFFEVFSFITVLSMVHFQEDITAYPGNNPEFFNQNAKFILEILSITFPS